MCASAVRHRSVGQASFCFARVPQDRPRQAWHIAVPRFSWNWPLWLPLQTSLWPSLNRRELQDHLGQSLDLTPGERARLSIHAAWLQTKSPSVVGLRRRVADLLPPQRSRVGEFLIGIAAADGTISPEEVDVLRRIYPILNLDPDDLYSHIHSYETSPGDTGAPSEPVTIRPQGPSAPGARIPSPLNGQTDGFTNVRRCYPQSGSDS